MAGMHNYSTLKYAQRRPRSNLEIEDYDDENSDDYLYDNNQQMHITVDDAQMAYKKTNDILMQQNEVQQMYLDSMENRTNSRIKHGNSDRELSLPLEKNNTMRMYYDSMEDEISVRKYLGYGVQWVSLVTENLLSHPFIVLRRQCQVSNASQRYHLHPVLLFPSIVHLHKRQGVTTLWKGLGSCLLVRGMSMAVDDLISKVTLWPKEVDNRTSIKRFGQHVLLKCISITVVMPFYAASLVETVQSDIASEKPGMFDIFREGSLRMLYWKYPQKGRMLPVWALIGPTVSLGITKYLFSLVIKGLSTRIIRTRLNLVQERKGARLKDDSLAIQNVEIYSNLISILTTEVIFYPFETILHRIMLQGTRTIVDNLDNGYAVVPILTNYQSAMDCYRATLGSEGFLGLYKGFGAMILQFAAHVAVIKLTKWVVGRISESVSNKPPAKVMQYYHLNPEYASNSTTISPTISSISLNNSIGTASLD